MEKSRNTLVPGQLLEKAMEKTWYKAISSAFSFPVLKEVDGQIDRQTDR